MLIDSHQHFWQLGRHGSEWPTPDLAPLYRDFTPDDLREVSAGNGVTGWVTVQSQPSMAETQWLLQLAAETPEMLGVVGWADLAAPNAADAVAGLATNRKLKGLRPMLQALPDDGWIAQPALEPALDAMVQAGLTLDALVFTRHLPHLAKLCGRLPELSVVIDHAAKPPIAAGGFQQWAAAIAAVAAFPQVFCKLSGLLTEAAAGQNAAELAPFVAHLVCCFGPERLMWGSDWPVLNLAGSYDAWLEVSLSLTGLEGRDLNQVRFATAQRFYGI